MLLKVGITYERASNLRSGTGNSKVISEGGHVAHQDRRKRVHTVLFNDPGLLCHPSSDPPHHQIQESLLQWSTREVFFQSAEITHLGTYVLAYI